MPILRAPPVKTRESTLAERIDALHDEIEALIADYVAAERAANPGIPEGVILRMLEAKYTGCKCAIYQHGLAKP